MTERAEESAYGRSLVYLQGRSQVEGAGVAATPGSVGYQNAVFDRVRNPSGVAEQLVEASIPEGPLHLDGWLALVSNGKHRAYTRDDVLAFVRSGEVEALLSEFIDSHCRVIRTDPELKPVQVYCRTLPLWLCCTSM